MILILINFHFLCISSYESMLVQAGSFLIPFSLLETVVKRYNASHMSDFALLHGLYSRDEETLMTIEIEIIFK